MSGKKGTKKGAASADASGISFVQRLQSALRGPGGQSGGAGGARGVSLAGTTVYLSEEEADGVGSPGLLSEKEGACADDDDGMPPLISVSSRAPGGASGAKGRKAKASSTSTPAPAESAPPAAPAPAKAAKPTKAPKRKPVASQYSSDVSDDR